MTTPNAYVDILDLPDSLAKRLFFASLPRPTSILELFRQEDLEAQAERAWDELSGEDRDRWVLVAHEVQRIAGQQADQIKRKVWKALFS